MVARPNSMKNGTVVTRIFHFIDIVYPLIISALLTFLSAVRHLKILELCTKL